MTIFLALKNYYLRMALLLFMSKYSEFGYRNVQSIDDLSSPDFSELFQLNESLYGLRSNVWDVVAAMKCQ